MSTKQSSECCSFVTEVSLELLPQLGVVGRCVARHLASGNHRAILSAVINPNGYHDWRSFMFDYQAIMLLRKYPGLRTGIDLQSVALGKFLATEETCKVVNMRFGNPRKHFRPETVRLLTKARGIIGRILGVFSWDLAVPHFDYGPGASVGLSRKRSHQCEKIGNLNPTVTGLCMPLVETYMRFDPHMCDLGSTPKIVDGSRATTVPKDARGDRFIAIEPLWNMFFQKGIGGVIRDRLRRIGLDLNKAQDVNRRLALEGSLTGRLATIDLSSASDTVSLGLVEFLLPECWQLAMKTVRSPRCMLPDGTSVLLRKISSMGNGFTFELESLIFLALALACSPKAKLGRDVAVFGDDIILPSVDAKVLCDVLTDIGFKVNTEKSFVTGPFRESCGLHCFLGRDVTPFFIKKVYSVPHERLAVVNAIRRFAHRAHGTGYGCSRELRSAWELALSRLPPSLSSLSVPDGFGDGGVVRDFDEVSPRPKAHSSFVEGYLSKSVAMSPPKRSFNDLPALISKLWYTRRGVPLGEVSQRVLEKPVPSSRYRIRLQHFPRWSTLGPWLD